MRPTGSCSRSCATPSRRSSARPTTGCWSSPGPAGPSARGPTWGTPTARPPATAVPGLVRMRRLGDVALALHRLTKPTIAKVDGVAVGAGLSLALGCDLVVASDRARLSMIFSRRGLSLDNGASWLLPRLIGLAKAKEVAIFAEMLDAEAALATASSTGSCPSTKLDAFVDGWAATPGRRPAPGPVDDQDPAQRLVRLVDGRGGRGRGPLPGGELRHRRPRRGHGGVRTEARAPICRTLRPGGPGAPGGRIVAGRCRGSDDRGVGAPPGVPGHRRRCGGRGGRSRPC